MLGKSQQEIEKRQRRRDAKNSVATVTVTLGGLGVVLAISLIFIYLVYEVYPLLVPADAQKLNHYQLPGDNENTLGVSFEGLLKSGARVSKSGKVIFFKPGLGKISEEIQIPLPANAKITSVYKTEPRESSEDKKTINHEIYALGLSNGQVIFVDTYYSFTYGEKNERIIKPHVKVALSGKPYDVGLTEKKPADSGKDASTADKNGASANANNTGAVAATAGDKSSTTAASDSDSSGDAIIKLAAEFDEDSVNIVSLNARGQLVFTRFEKEEGLTGVTYTRTAKLLKDVEVKDVQQLLLSKTLFSLYLLSKDSSLTYYRFEYKSNPKLIQHIPSVVKSGEVRSAALLVGGDSLLLGDSNGNIQQWIPRQTKTNYELKNIRTLKLGNAPITALAIEYGRKGFIAGDADGYFGLFHTTANKRLYKKKITATPIAQLYMAPRNNAIFALDAKNQLHGWAVNNPHPEVSWEALTQKIYYEGHATKKLIWQSTGGSDDAEPKFSLIPLTIGTLKAAFYAMLISIPLAVFGAMFTAHFMTPRMRRIVKPSIELMEALPTVIIGFLAGLWLAPLVADNLVAVFLILVILPLGIVMAGRVWDTLPRNVRHYIPEGWEAAILIPVILLMGWITFYFIGPAIEATFFKGSLSAYLAEVWEVPYRQRNSVVIGLAMGFAVIPTIFSITEDAIFGVPKHLSHGSLALGATPWQTMSRVVILTASPGIFSAVMIGFGRAVGETMIVLMAAGNTAVTSFSPFTGSRTLAANIATELPEAARYGTLFRILFLTALVLFVFTFLFNTLAEIVRQRLRNKYSNL